MNELMTPLLNHRLTAANPAAFSDDSFRAQVMTVLFGIRPVQANGSAYDAQTKLGEAGFTSLEMVNVMLGVEAAFDLMIPAGDITAGNFATAASIAAMIKRLK